MQVRALTNLMTNVLIEYMHLTSSTENIMAIFTLDRAKWEKEYWSKLRCDFFQWIDPDK